MYYEINKKNIKQSAKNVSNYFEKEGYLIPKDKLLEYLKKSFIKGNCLFKLESFESIENTHLITLDLTENNNNIITALFFLKEIINESKYKITKAEMARIFIEKENLSKLFE